MNILVKVVWILFSCIYAICMGLYCGFLFGNVFDFTPPNSGSQAPGSAIVYVPLFSFIFIIVNLLSLWFANINRWWLFVPFFTMLGVRFYIHFS